MGGKGWVRDWREGVGERPSGVHGIAIRQWAMTTGAYRRTGAARRCNARPAGRPRCAAQPRTLRRPALRTGAVAARPCPWPARRGLP
eukprot:scaffold8266_cov69-Isochrysis_galbana.AAC.4